ncbi:MAG: hypothetical protein R3179_01900 [Sedimenticolaceae bacterium]|nr:hypothetical protein [Sedimenticolaceae bacterium]
MSGIPDKGTYLHLMQAAIDATDFESLNNFGEKLDHLLRSVYLAMEMRRDHLAALDACPDTATRRNQQLRQRIRDIERRIRHLTGTAHALALETFRLPFHHEQVINAAYEEFAWENVIQEG